MNRRVLVTDYAWPSVDIERELLAQVGAELVVPVGDSPEELVDLARDVDAVLTNWKRLPIAALDAAPRCIVVSRYGIGLDNIPVDHATQLGIVVTNVPDFCVDEVSDHTMALILACSRRIVPFVRATSAGVWDAKSGPGACNACGARPSASSAMAAWLERWRKKQSRSVSPSWPTRPGSRPTSWAQG